MASKSAPCVSKLQLKMLALIYGTMLPTLLIRESVPEINLVKNAGYIS